MFVVLVTHNTGHGDVTEPVQLTGNLSEAVATCRRVETMGYQFYGNEIGAGIYELGPEKRPYRKAEQTMVFYRQHYREPRSGSNWQEDWFDENLKAKYLREHPEEQLH